MRALLILAISLGRAAAVNTTDGECCIVSSKREEYCSYGQSFGGYSYAQACQQDNLKCNPKDLNCQDGPLSDPSCPTFEYGSSNVQPCAPKCCDKGCCGAYGYGPGQVDTTCCSAASMCYSKECDHRCELKCVDPITWAKDIKQGSTWVFDVNGFETTYPKHVWLWGTNGKDYNGNKLFYRDNRCDSSSPGGRCDDDTSLGRGWLVWEDTNYNEKCVTASDSKQQAEILVNDCALDQDGEKYIYNPLQQWGLVKTSYGHMIQLKNTNLCIVVVNDLPKVKQPLQLWECVPGAIAHSWILQENQNYPGKATISV